LYIEVWFGYVLHQVFGIDRLFGNQTGILLLK